MRIPPFIPWTIDKENRTERINEEFFPNSFESFPFSHSISNRPVTYSSSMQFGRSREFQFFQINFPTCAIKTQSNSEKEE